MWVCAIWPWWPSSLFSLAPWISMCRLMASPCALAAAAWPSRVIPFPSWAAVVARNAFRLASAAPFTSLPWWGEFMAFLFVFFFWDSYDSNVGAFDIVPEVSEIVLIYFNSFFLSVSFILPFYLLPHLT